jgi:hypothetical protein
VRRYSINSRGFAARSSATHHGGLHEEELEAILGDDENTPDLGPIEDYLHAVATKRKLPDLAVGICTPRTEESAAKLRALLARAADGAILSDD